MGLPFVQHPLSNLDGEVFDSHKRKHEEIVGKWEKYPFKQYQLVVKSKKSFKFRKAYAECSCGRKANLSCTFDKCRKCCLKGLGECKAHKR